MMLYDLIYILQNTAGGRVLKMHNTKHDQKACTWIEVVTIEHPRNPFSVFHKYSSRLCEASRNMVSLCQIWLQRATHNMPAAMVITTYATHY